MRISDWSSDVCSSDLVRHDRRPARIAGVAGVFGPAGVLGCAGVLGATWRLRSAGTGRSARLLRGTGVGCGGAGLLLHRAGVAWLGRSRTRIDGGAGLDLRLLQPLPPAPRLPGWPRAPP